MNIKLWLKLALTLTMLTAFTGLATAQQKREPKAGATPAQAQPATGGIKPAPQSKPGKCDLAITKSLAHMMIHPPFQTGQQLTFEILVTNHGTGPCGAPTSVTDTFSAGLTYVSGGGSGWTCGPPIGSSVPCNNPPLSLAPSQTSNFFLTFTVTGPPPSMIGDCAIVTNKNDTNVGNNRACLEAPVIPPVPCNLSAAPMCGGTCPAGQACKSNTTALACGCMGPPPPCGPIPGTNMCGGTCLQGQVCIKNPSTGVCGCGIGN
jgi:uncharacterized repeat protein (TIGR01451 family)